MIKLNNQIGKFCIAIILLVAQFSLGQGNLHKTLNASNGLLSDDNYMTIQDQDRFIWILSEKGILKYDGVDFKSFTVADGLPLNDIWYIKEDRDGRKWLGGFYDGLFYIEDDVVKEVPCASKSNSVLFTSETEDTLFFTSFDEKRSYFMLHDMKQLQPVHLKPKEEIKVRLEDKTLVNFFEQIDSCYIIYHDTKECFRTKGKISMREAILRENKQYVALKADQEERWVIKLRNDYKVIRPNHYFASPLLTVNTLQPSGDLILHFKDRIVVYKDLSKGIRDYSMEDRLEQFNKRRMAWTTLDDEGNVWISLERNNIIMIPRGVENIDQYPFEAGNRINYVNPIIHNDKLVFHELTGSLYEYDLQTQELKMIYEPIDRAKNGVNDLQKTEDGYFFLTPSAIAYQPCLGPRKEFLFHERVPTPLPRKFIPLGNNQFLSNNLAIFQLRGNEIYEVSEPISTERINCLAQSKNHWITATPKELLFIDKNTQEVDKVEISGIQCILPMGRFVVIGTNGYGMMIVDRTGKIYASSHEGKSINIIVAYEDYIISSSNKGVAIDQIDASHQIKTHSFIRREQGLSSNNINSVVISGDQLFATSNVGFDVINLKEILKRKSRQPTIVIDSVVVNGLREPLESNSFSSNQNSITFHFSGISYSSLGNIRYKYRLIGVEDEWVLTEESNIRFPSLPPGSYTFEVVAISADNDESNIEKYTFSIDKHFTQTWWFSTAILTLVGFGIGVLVYQIQRRKTRKLEIEKQIANLEMNALQSQMNPHFVFNSLNAIQSVLFLKGERETNRYIGAFSKLIRQTLDNSKKGRIKIQEEVDYLSTYLDLESRRLDGNLSYSIEIDEELEENEIVIPCMIVQPMVENAILHGLSPMPSGRKLIIRFNKLGDQLQIEVEDNGIGRANAQKDSSRRNHKSWASTILQERLAVLKKLNLGEITYKIIDLYTNNEPSGTLIQIQLPISYAD